MTKVNARVAEIEDRIEQLVFITDDFLKLSEKIGKFYSDNKNKILKNFKVLNSNNLKALIIQQKLFISEVLLNFKTLFETQKSPREISYIFLFKELSETTEYYKKFKEINEYYRKTNLASFRNKLIAHKELQCAGDPMSHYLNPISEDVLKDCREIVDRLKQLNADFNNDPTANNYMGIYKATSNYLDMIQTELEKLIQ